MAIMNPQLKKFSEARGFAFVEPKTTLNRTLHDIRIFLFNYLPALIVWLMLWRSPKRNALLKLHDRTMRPMNAMSHFRTREWLFDNGNARALFRSLDEHDRREFCFDMDSIDWHEFLSAYCISTMDLFIRSVPNLESFCKLIRLRVYAVSLAKTVLSLGLAQISCLSLWLHFASK